MVAPASTLEPRALADLFNAGFSDYLLPMRLSDAAFREHLAVNDIDLDASQVVLGPSPEAFALIARRHDAGWVAIVFRQDAETVTTVQIAALDDGSAADALLAAAGGERALRLANVPVDEPPSRAVHHLGARRAARQREMLLRFGRPTAVMSSED